jgi:tetratricopeptide (TPR) repeat protein
MRLISVILISLLTISAFGQKKKSGADLSPEAAAYNQKLSAALKLQVSEQYENAEQAFDELLKSQPSKGEVYYYYGETVIKDYLSDTLSNSLAEMAGKANELFAKGIQQDSLNMLNNIGLGAICLLRSNDTIAADKYFIKVEKSIPIKVKQLKPIHALFLTKMGMAQLYGKDVRFDKAINYLLKAAEIDPTNPNIFVTLGDVYIRKNDASNALASYKKALFLDPKSPLPKIKIGNIYTRVPNLNAARPYFEEARQIDSTFAPVYRELGELYSMAGNFNLSKANFRKFLELSGDNVPAKIQYAKALFRTKDYVTALEILDEILAVDKSKNYLNRLAAFCCYENKPPQLEKGKAYMEDFFKNAKTESLIPRDFAYYGRILYKMAKTDSVMLANSFDNFKKAYLMDTNDVNLISEVALYAYNVRSYKDAIYWLTLKNRKGKASDDDMMTLAKSYYQATDYRGADSVFTKITEKRTDYVPAYIWSARSASQRDTSFALGLAEPKFLQVIKQVGSDTVKYINEMQESYSYLGFYNYMKKNYPDARMWDKRFFNLDPTNKQWQIKALRALALVAYKEKNFVEQREYYYQLKKLDPTDTELDKNIKELTRVIESGKIFDELNKMK